MSIPFRTHIDDLDELMGLGREPADGRGIPTGSVLLIRGEPGAGKTTLALQILSRVLEKRTADRAVFISLESRPEDALKKSKDSFKHFPLEADQRVAMVRASDIEEYLKHGAESKLSMQVDAAIPTDIGGLVALAGREAARVARRVHATRQLQKFYEKYDSTSPVVAVDSLNVFVRLLQRLYPALNERLALHMVCTTLRDHFKDAVLVLTGEYHYQDSDKDSIVAESFYSDIVVALFSEPIVVFQQSALSNTSPLGANVIRRAHADDLKSVHMQSFCRVLKSRYTPNQARRCSYDIVPGKGIEFFPTYPGDGQLLLFAENAAQKKLWGAFSDRDIPHFYPALRFGQFDRSGLQRTSAAQRRFRYVPERADMILLSFDNYWVNWYTELCRKWTIVEIYSGTVGADRAAAHPPLVNRTYRELDRLLLELSPEDKEALDLLTRSNDQSGIYDCVRCLWGRSLVSTVLPHTLPRSLPAEEARAHLNAILKTVLSATPLGRDASETDADHDAAPGAAAGAVPEPLKKALTQMRTDAKKLLKRDRNCRRQDYWDSLAAAPDPLAALERFERSDCHWSQVLLADATKGRLKTAIERDVFSESFLKHTIEEGLGQAAPNGFRALCNLFYTFIDGEEPQYSMLHAIPDDQLRLFGERKSQIIHELDAHHLMDRRPVNRPDKLFSIKHRGSYVSVPYDANIAFLAYRKDIVDRFVKGLWSKTDRRNAFATQVHQLVTLQDKTLRGVWAETRQIADLFFREERIDAVGIDKQRAEKLLADTGIESQAWTATAGSDRRLKWFHDRLLDPEKYRLGTWEEIAAFFGMTFSAKRPRHFLIETRTPDTLLCTLLEFLWNCGGNLRVEPDYSIDQPQHTFQALLLAFFQLAYMFKRGWTPEDSTLEPLEFGRRYCRAAEQPAADWVFARHWYSTFIDVLTARSERDQHDGQRSALHDECYPFAGQSLGIMPIPTTLSGGSGDKLEGISCWGDWHLALISGTENTSLGVDLINNLLSSDRVCERAAANAALPTVEEFYRIHGDSRCFNLPGVEPVELPRTTYRELREKYFQNARSRSQVFDYHHCMREFEPVIEYVRTASSRGNKCSSDAMAKEMRVIAKMLLRVFWNIESFSNKRFLMA